MNYVGPARPGYVPGAGIQSGQGNQAENSPIIASGKATLDLTAPTAANLSTVSPSSLATNLAPDQLTSLVTVDLLPHMSVPEDFVTLGTAASNNQYLAYAAEIVPTYTGRARVMIQVEWEENGAKWPTATSADSQDFRTYIGRQAFCIPWVTGWNNTSFNWGTPSTASLLTTGAATYRTTGPEILSSVIGHGSWEIELSEWCSGARFVNLGLQYFHTYDANVTYPDRVHFYYTVIAEEGRDETYALPQCQIVNGTGLPTNAGGVAGLNYQPSTFAAEFSGTKFDKINTVQIWNGTTVTIDADVRFQTGTRSLSGYEIGAAAVGPVNIPAGNSGIWTTNSGVSYEAFTAMAHVCRIAAPAATGNIGIWAFGG